jgi:hypothetical protein
MLLDVQTYRDNENIAKSTLGNWRAAQRHNLDIFEKHGFPVRLHSLPQLRQMLDTMQENRFRVYMEELGGLSDTDLKTFLRACQAVIRFQQINFQGLPIILPLSTMLAYFVIYKKIIGMRPNLSNILEIGPGCGYLSFFLEPLEQLENYSQIEACESFYLLQNLINSHTFQESFSQEAITPVHEQINIYTQSTFPDSIENSIKIANNAAKKCFHYPWWQINKLAQSETKFDVITSNANLLEINPAALTDYLVLVGEKLAPDGLFFMHCTGFPGQGTTESLMDTLFKHGFAPFLLLPGWGAATEYKDQASQRTVSKKFAVINGVFATSTHAQFRRYYNRDNMAPPFMADVPDIAKAFFSTSTENRTMYSKEDIADMLVRA